jgi:hypothetical protein
MTTPEIDTLAHDAASYTKTYNLSPAETAALVNDAAAAASRAYQVDDISTLVQYRGLTGVTTPTPTVSTLTPSTLAKGLGEFDVVVAGTNFQAWSIVLWNGAPRPTTFISATSLKVRAPSVISAGVVPVRVTSGADLISNAVNFTFT